VRVVAALVALVIGGGFLTLAAAGVLGIATPTLGKSLFGVLTWLSLATALASGLFFTSDCVSEEKREGTLGLLFLTNLHGYDIVLGKLLATSLRGFYALLAVLPVLGVTLLMGGVTGMQFARTSLALFAALLLSLASGLFVSALSRDSQKAMIGTLFLLLFWGGAGPASDGLIALIQGQGFEPVLSLASPVYLFLMAGAWGKTPFAQGLLVNALVVAMLLGLTSVLIRHTWQQRVAARATPLRAWTRWWRLGGARRQAALRRRLLDVNPVLWLACRERWQAASLWGIALLLAGAFAAVFGLREEEMWWFGWNYLAGPVTLILYLGAASQTARLLVDARRSGLLELCLSTPLGPHQILQGQWRALLRLFGPPLVLCLVTQGLGNVLVQQMMWNRIAATVPATTAPATPPLAITNAVTTGSGVITTSTTTTARVQVTGPGGSRAVLAGFSPPGSLMAVFLASTSLLAVAANLVALVWFGMWMGLNSKSANLATLKTILFVQVIPWFAITFTSALAVPLLLLPRLIAGGGPAPTQMIVWFPVLSAAVGTLFCLGKDAGFVLYARSRLHTKLQQRGL
jgi:hypothetical protein